MKKAISKHQVLVDGKVCLSGKYINGGETIELHPLIVQNRPQLELDLDVLYEDEQLALVYKPAGLVVSGNKMRTLENALGHNLSMSAAVDALPYPEPIHRLDHPTSGVLLIGKTRHIVTALNKLFENKEISKTYIAITIGDYTQAKGTIDTPLKGKSAVTHYEVLATVASEKFTKLNLVRLSPETGRRHQLRVHMLELGHPILGDKEYALADKTLYGKGLFLHAQQLEFKHPDTQEILSITAKTPSKFLRIFPNV